MKSLRARNWQAAVPQSEKMLSLFEKEIKQENFVFERLEQAELFLVAGETDRATRFAMTLVDVGRAKDNMTAHMRWRGLRFLVDAYLAEPNLKRALEYQELLFSDFQTARPLEWDGGRGQIEIDSYLLPLRVAVKEDLFELKSLANFGYKAHLEQGPAIKFMDEENEQKRKIAAVSNVVLARYYQSKGNRKLANEALKKAIQIMESHQVIVNREILLWFLAQEQLKKPAT